MKFTDGYWQIRAGMTPHYAAQAYEVEIESDAMTVYAPTKKLQGRGDIINLHADTAFLLAYRKSCSCSDHPSRRRATA